MIKIKAKDVGMFSYLLVDNYIYAAHPDYPPMKTTYDPHGWEVLKFDDKDLKERDSK